MFPVQAGSRLSWSVEGEKLVAWRVRGVSELRGCLQSEVAFPGIEAEKAAVAANRASHCQQRSEPHVNLPVSKPRFCRVLGVRFLPV